MVVMSEHFYTEEGLKPLSHDNLSEGGDEREVRKLKE